MGMYTQAKAILNIASISSKERFKKTEKKLQNLQHKYINESNYGGCVCEDTHVFMGGNASIFISFGTELKNYDNGIMNWLEYLINNFPSSEGIITIQYEEDEKADVYNVYKGKINKKISEIESIGYGNC